MLFGLCDISYFPLEVHFAVVSTFFSTVLFLMFGGVHLFVGGFVCLFLVIFSALICVWF